MSYTSIRAQLDTAPEPIIAIRVEKDAGDWGDYGMEGWVELEWQGRPILPFFGPVSEAPDVMLDRQYDDGFGGQDVPDFYIWTENFVGCVHEYDGATHTRWIPRNPS